MSGECSSSPISGCTDSQTIDQLEILTDLLELKLGEINVKIGEITADYTECCDVNNGILTDIIDKFDEIIHQAEDCCEAILSNLDKINDELDNIIHGGETVPTTTAEPVIVTTTTGETVPTTTGEDVPTTTEAPEVPTTTAAPVIYSSRFELDDSSVLICSPDATAESNVLLYYEGVWDEAHWVVDTITVYRNADLTGLVAYDFIKKSSSDRVYNMNNETGLVGAYEKDCEAI